MRDKTNDLSARRNSLVRAVRCWLCTVALLAVSLTSASAQAGGNFEITQSTISNGGEQSAGGGSAVFGTLGQAVATGADNASSGGQFSIAGGFWSFAAPANTTPTPTPEIVAVGALLVNESCPPTNGTIDPGERVSVSLNVMNNGLGSTTNLVATLQASGNVLAPGGSQNYGAIAPGDMASRTFSITANGTCGENITLSLQLQDGMTNLGTVIYSLTLGCNSSCQIARLVTTNVALSCVGGNVQADITLQNQGIVTATGVTLTQAQLGSPAVDGASAPQGPFTLAPGATQNFTVTFATACPFTGTKLLRLKGTSTNAGSWGSTSAVTSP